MGYDGENLYLGIDEPEPKTVGQCAYCRDDICEGSEYFCCGSVMVHAARRSWPVRLALRGNQREL